MVHTRRKLIDRVMAVISSFLMVIALFPVNVHAVEDPVQPLYATVTALTGGTVEGSGTENVTVTLAYLNMKGKHIST